MQDSVVLVAGLLGLLRVNGGAASEAQEVCEQFESCNR